MATDSCFFLARILDDADVDDDDDNADDQDDIEDCAPPRLSRVGVGTAAVAAAADDNRSSPIAVEVHLEDRRFFVCPRIPGATTLYVPTSELRAASVRAISIRWSRSALHVAFDAA